MPRLTALSLPAVFALGIYPTLTLTEAACSWTGSRSPAMSPGAWSPGPADETAGNTESYAKIDENVFLTARDTPLSTFSIDVDTASYSNVRRFLENGALPPVDAVRIEELVNYFRYADPPPQGAEALAVRTEVGPCPWAPAHRLLRIGLRARELPAGDPPPRNLTFLIDVSGSMSAWNKLPLVQRALGLVVEQLTARDRLALVVYAGAAGMVLPPTAGTERGRIAAALERLSAGGSTNGGEGIELAYAAAERSFIPGGVNRVILATDGDFNVGVNSPGALERLIEAKRQGGVFLTVLGFGMGNLKDSTMEMLADRGNGNYAYIDSFAEARKVLVEDVAGTLVTALKDVKIQVEMNPAAVRRYRLLGYENRVLRRDQFADDKADAGDMGAGQTVTALYELELARGDASAPEPLRYQQASPLTALASQDELLLLKVRYKHPEEADSHLGMWAVRDSGQGLASTSNDFRFASAVVALGLALRGSPHRGSASAAMALDLARSAAAAGGDPHRREFLALAEKARALAHKSD